MIVDSRGEMVLVIDRKRDEDLQPNIETMISERVAQLVGEGLDQKAALKQIAKERGIGKSEAYRLLQSEKQ